MQQQLLESTVNIVPDTMNAVISQLTVFLSQNSIQLAGNLLSDIIKSLFYGLWNFDKMINQHNLSTAISMMPHKIPKELRKNGLIFYESFFAELEQKWNLIDKHRINKFMQLVRYLIRQAFNFCKLQKIKRSKVDDILKNTIFKNLQSRNGIIYHVADIYFEVMTNYCVDNNEQFDLKNLQIFQYLLKQHKIEHFRYHVLDHIYGKYKTFLIESFNQEPEQLQQQLTKAVNHFLGAAKNEEKDLNRRNIYLLIGFLKSEHLVFSTYQLEQFILYHRKRQKAKSQKEKVKKKISKHKIKLMKEEKIKRKEKKKINPKNKKIISKSRGQNIVERKNKKYIQNF